MPRYSTQSAYCDVVSIAGRCYWRAGVKTYGEGKFAAEVLPCLCFSYLGEEGYEHHTRYGGINKEEDFFDLHVTRLVAGLLD